MSVARIIVAASFLFSTACGGPHQSPTSASPTPPTPIPGNAPTVRVEIKVDDSGARDAVVQLSDVFVDASGSAGTGSLTFSLDYGDGFVASSSTAHHAYSVAGTYTVTVTVTDGQARKTSDSRQVTVRSLAGSWFEAEYVQKSRRVEVRRLTVTAQDGLTIRGRYEVTGAASRSFTGTLTAPRTARTVIDDGATLEGVIPDRLNDAAAKWMMQARGDTVDGERLEFQPIVGDATSPAPDAVMKFRFPPDDAWAPIAAVSPIEIDGAASRGSGLAYFIEFGDGYESAGPQAVHVVDAPEVPQIRAQLTVVDAFGRSDSESLPYNPFVLNGLGDYWYRKDDGTTDTSYRLFFKTRSGADYTGSAIVFGVSSTPLKATLSSPNRIRIVLAERGIELQGEIKFGRPGYSATDMTLRQVGGPDNGRIWTFRLANEY
jgi:PKD repeat protein